MCAVVKEHYYQYVYLDVCSWQETLVRLSNICCCQETLLHLPGYLHCSWQGTLVRLPRYMLLPRNIAMPTYILCCWQRTLLCTGIPRCVQLPRNITMPTWIGAVVKEYPILNHLSRGYFTGKRFPFDAQPSLWLDRGKTEIHLPRRYGNKIPTCHKLLN